jgi:hypothetical protein
MLKNMRKRQKLTKNSVFYKKIIGTGDRKPMTNWEQNAMLSNV